MNTGWPYAVLPVTSNGYSSDLYLFTAAGILSCWILLRCLPYGSRFESATALETNTSSLLQRLSPFKVIVSRRTGRCLRTQIRRFVVHDGAGPAYRLGRPGTDMSMLVSNYGRLEASVRPLEKLLLQICIMPQQPLDQS